MVRLKKLGVWSVAKLQAIFMAILGLIVGIFYVILIKTLGALAPGALGPGVGLIVGLGFFGIIIFIIFISILYVIIGFIVGALVAFLYNLVAKWVGGIEMEFEIESEQ